MRLRRRTDRKLRPFAQQRHSTFVGAYGFSTASNYNNRPRAPEVLIDGDIYKVIRRRETLEDLVAAERM